MIPCVLSSSNARDKVAGIVPKRAASSVIEDLDTPRIDCIEQEHQKTGAALAQLRWLTDDFRPPEWVCNTYRALLAGLLRLEQDLHRHIHKENNILFPLAIANL